MYGWDGWTFWTSAGTVGGLSVGLLGCRDSWKCWDDGTVETVGKFDQREFRLYLWRTSGGTVEIIGLLGRWDISDCWDGGTVGTVRLPLLLLGDFRWGCWNSGTVGTVGLLLLPNPMVLLKWWHFWDTRTSAGTIGGLLVGLLLRPMGLLGWWHYWDGGTVGTGRLPLVLLKNFQLRASICINWYKITLFSRFKSLYCKLIYAFFEFWQKFRSKLLF